MKKFIVKMIGFLIYIMLGIALGCFFAIHGIPEIVSLEPGKEIYYIILFAGMLFLSMVLQIIIHEAGHLLFGLLTGYKFSSFRIFQFMFMKQGKKIVVKRLEIAGSGGQCLMVPPEPVDGKIPVVLYNLGGCILNVVSAILSIGIAMLSNHTIIFLICMMMGVIGLVYAVLNGIPMMGTVNNDGHNVVSLAKNKEAMRAFSIMLKVNELIAMQHVRMKDMPEEFFYMPEEKDLGNPLVASIGVFYCSYLMDRHEFEKGKENILYLLEKNTGVEKLYEGMLKCDLSYIYLLEGKFEEAKTLLEDKNVKNIRKSMRNYPSIIRFEYAVAKQLEKNEKKAEEKMKLFHKISKSYPHPADIESEMELMEMID